MLPQDTFPIKAGVLQGNVLGSLLYLLYTAYLPVSPEATTATYADDTSILTPYGPTSGRLRSIESNLYA